MKLSNCQLATYNVLMVCSYSNWLTITGRYVVRTYSGDNAGVYHYNLYTAISVELVCLKGHTGGTEVLCSYILNG